MAKRVKKLTLEDRKRMKLDEGERSHISDPRREHMQRDGGFAGTRVHANIDDPEADYYEN